MNTHPISMERAIKLMKGELGDVYRKILSNSCAPLFWYPVDGKPAKVAHNGTLTFVQTPRKIIGITAAHVIRQLQSDMQKSQFSVQVMNEVIDNFTDRIIDISDNRDLATIDISEKLVNQIGKTPIGNWPPAPPEEGRGIMISGYPNVELIDQALEASWGLFTAIGIARTVSQDQITWLVETERHTLNNKIPTPPPLYNLGGVSGGPLISWFESEAHVVHYRLSGVITEHPDYKGNHDFPPIERLIASRADFISETGKIIF